MAEVYQKLPITSHKVTVKSIQNGAISSRDWQPLHSDKDWAVTQANLPNIIMNNYTVNGWIIKYITDHFTHSARIGKVSFKIKKPICPNDLMEFHAKIIDKNVIDKNRSWLYIDLDIKVNGMISASSKVNVAIDESSQLENSPWKLNSKEWVSCMDLLQQL